MLEDPTILGQARDLLIAYALAFPIGWDRERSDRSAGIRTFPLVALASCGFLQAAEPLVTGEAGATARIMEGLITGIGFIGGGAIIRSGQRVHGTATAAGLWVTGAIGVATALQSYAVAVVLSLATICTLRGLRTLKYDRDESK
ncbi:MgtC/SapB family protein [Roseomonas sp. E05]|uniref:MgtC/SapB family protein n=1 Tax=Roseomonas sp. E05 TaxID=3046310 RepID=UPI0024B9A0FD|nr:MgtC/SapB family protein [Roseomonas sp. E05]MDJ0388359.1 MgtC/SapB family protein [Roseomonas sp. E05]